MKYVIRKEALDAMDQISDALMIGNELDVKFRDHPLKGPHSEYRLCHVEPDLLLMYRIDSVHDFVELSDIGSHSKLFKR